MTAQRVLKALSIVAVATVVAACSNPEKKKAQHLQAGDALVAQKKYAEAILEYRNALKVDQHFAEARLNLAKAYVETQDLGLALREYARAADLMPENAEVQLAAARLLVRAGRFEDAKTRVEKVLLADPKNVQANLVLGSALVGLKDIDGAIKQVEEAVAIDPLDGKSQTTLGVLSLAKGDKTRAEAAFAEAVRVKPQMIEARVALASFYWTEKRLADAEHELKAALQIDPSGDLANRALAAFYMQSGRRAEAEAYLKTLADKGDPRSKLALADFYLGMRRLHEAKDLLKSIESDKQVGVVASGRLALILFFGEQRAADAYAIADGLIAKGTETASAYLLKGRFLLAEKRLEPAIDALRAAVKADPKLAPAHYMLGNALQANQDLAGAADSYRAALEIVPGATLPQLQLARVSLMRGDATGSLHAASTALEKQPGNPLARLLMAEALIGKREFAQAAEEIARLKAKYPKVAQVHVAEGKLFGSQNNPVKATRAYTLALSIDPKSSEALAGLIGVDLTTGNSASAVARSESLLQLRPGDAAVQLLAARAYYAAKNESKAEEILKAVIQHNGRHTSARSLLADLYVKQRKPQQALEQFQGILAVEPKSIQANTIAGMILQEQNRIPEAKKHYETALASSPNASVAANNLAWILADERQDLERALALANQAATLRPNDPKVADTIGWVYMQKQLPTLAVPAFEKAVGNAPNNPEFLYHLGKAYAATGENAKARANLQKALAISSTFTGAAEARGLLSSLGS